MNWCDWTFLSPSYPQYFEQDDPELYLSKIKYVLETDLDQAESVPELYFAEDVYDSQGRLVETHDLIPGGSAIRVDLCYSILILVEILI